MNTKLRRHSGRKTARIIFDGMNKKDIIENCLEPQVAWNDWLDYRDGFRNHDDKKHIRNIHSRISSYLKIDYWNKKLKKLIQRRKARKRKY